MQTGSKGLERVEGVNLDRSSSDLGVTSECRINDAPLASPDVSTLSGSSESSIHNTDSSEQIAAVISAVTDSDDEDENSDATFIADSDTGSSSTATVIDTSLISKGGERDKEDGVSLNSGEQMTASSTNSLDELDNDDSDMKGEKVRAIAEKLNGKLVLGAGGATEQRNGDNVAKIVALTPESSDTDSVNTTPSDSPAKTKLDGVVLRPPSLTRAKNSGMCL